MKEIDFDSIYPFWRDHLWPDRKSAIRPISSLQFLSQNDMGIYNFSDEVRFWALINSDNEIIGVNSGFPTTRNLYRSRGVWIHPDCRGWQLSHLLFSTACQAARSFGCSEIWSLPRKSSLNAYLSFGFQKCSPWFNNTVEFGPNCYVRLKLK